MKGIILAAGRGSRMGAGTDKLPKCRSVLHGKSLLQWQLDSLSQAGVNQVGLVRGYLGETFHEPLAALRSMDASVLEKRESNHTRSHVGGTGSGSVRQSAAHVHL